MKLHEGFVNYETSLDFPSAWEWEFSFLGELIFQLGPGALTLTSTLPFATPDWLTRIQCYIVTDHLSGHMILDDVVDWLLWLLSQGHCRTVGECRVVVGEVAGGQR